MISGAWVAVDRPALRERIRQLSLPLSLLQPYLAQPGLDYSQCVAVLEWQDGVIQLRPMSAELGLPVVVDLTRGKSGYRFLRASHEMLVKAVAGRTKTDLKVMDMTAGLGRDAILLGAAGFEVTAVERHPAIACLLADGLDRAAMHPDFQAVLSRVQFSVGDAADVLLALPASQRPDVVYMDPMFPERSKQALVKKEMRLFRSVVGEDLDAENLFQQAKATALKRVVIKRPRKAPFLGQHKPGYQLMGKSSRFDVYPV